jgi:outer membrane protein, heavy metal efflux system
MHWKYTQIIGHTLTILLTMFGVIGCTTSYVAPLRPEQEHRLLGGDIPTFSINEGSTTESLVVKEPTGALTLRKALALALMRNPALAANSWSIRAAEARALQEGLPPNPDVRIRLNDFGGTGEWRGTGNTEQVVRVGQIIELGGKAAKRQRAARLAAALCGWDYETKRLDVFTGTSKAFVVVLAAQKRLAAAQEMSDSAKNILSLITRRVQGGGGAGLEIEEARIEFGNSQLELERAKNALQNARGLLANHWDEKTPRFQNVTGDLENISSTKIPTWEQAAAGIEDNPDVSRWETETRMRKAALEREKANAIPDLRVLFAGKRVEETGDHAFGLALEIPLPVFNRNQGNISAARSECRKVVYERREASMTATAALRQAYQSLSVSRREVKLVKDELLPAAQAICVALKEGALSDLDLLKAQQTLFKARVRQIDALEVFHASLADVERLTGQTIGDLASPDKKTDATPKIEAPKDKPGKS